MEEVLTTFSFETPTCISKGLPLQAPALSPASMPSADHDHAGKMWVLGRAGRTQLSSQCFGG